MTTQTRQRFAAVCNPPYPVVFNRGPGERPLPPRPEDCERRIIVEAATIEEAITKIIVEAGWERYDATTANWFCPVCAEANRQMPDGLFVLPKE